MNFEVENATSNNRMYFFFKFYDSRYIIIIILRFGWEIIIIYTYMYI